MLEYLWTQWFFGSTASSTQIFGISLSFLFQADLTRAGPLILLTHRSKVVLKLTPVIINK